MASKSQSPRKRNKSTSKDDHGLSTALRPPVKSIACNACHSRKIKCSGDKPCSKCKTTSRECVYPIRSRNITLKQHYVDRLLQENQQLRKETSTSDSDERTIVDPTATNVEETQNPVSRDRPWFVPAPASGIPLQIGDAADTAFSSRFRLVLSPTAAGHIPRMTYISDELLLNLSESRCDWPAPGRARYLLKVALNTICRCYYLVREGEVHDLLETILQTQSSITRLQECKLFALFALGELYSTKIAVKDDTFPGLAYFAHARKIGTIPFERPELDAVEAALLLSAYSFSMNRRYSAHSFASRAVRLGIVIGLHLRIPDAVSIPLQLKEHRIRIWWTAYIFDRTWALKLGHPVSIQDDDVQVDLPSQMSLIDGQRSDSLEYEYLLRHIELARLSGHTIESIYSRRQQQRPFSQRVQGLLAKLTEWSESLPQQLQLPKNGSGDLPHQSLLYLHLTFNQLVMLVTRPILLHYVRRNMEAGSKNLLVPTLAGADSAVTIAETCIRCARHSFLLLNEAWTSGVFAVFDYFYAQYLFSAAIVLAVSSITGTIQANKDSEDYSTAVAILEQLRECGNYGAKEFCLHTDALDQNLAQHISSTTSFIPNPVRSFRAVRASMGSDPRTMTTSMALTDPSLQGFLAQPEFADSLVSDADLGNLQNSFWPDMWAEDWSI